MGIIALLLLVALLIPILGIVFDSPIGRAMARRLEGPAATTPDTMVALGQKVELLEGEVDDLNRAVQELREENQFLQRLIEDTPRRPPLPPTSD